MGVNRVGFSIIDDDICRQAACQEIIRRYLIALCDYKKGIIDEDAVAKSKLLMDELELKISDRAVVLPAREYSEYKRSLNPKYENVIVMALELPDGRIITGRSSRRMVAAAAAVLNAIKVLSGISDDIHLISPAVLETIQHLKTDILGHEKTSLNCEEVLSALTISTTTNTSAQVAVEKLLLLNGCKAHCTAILSDRDDQTLKDLGIDATLKEYGFAVDVDLVYVGANLLNLVYMQRSERQRYERGNLVALTQVDFAFQSVANLLDRAEQHTARTRHGVAVFALFGHDAEHNFGNLLFVAACLGIDLGEAGRVDVQGLNVDQNLVVVDFHGVVDLFGGLRQYAFRFDNTVCSIRASFFHSCFLP